jgi:NDP-sugar pyrophosphorylase family protein
MRAVILAGGLGERLKPFTEVIPKPLLPIGEKSILEIQISRLRRCGVTAVILATNYRSQYIESFLGAASEIGVDLSVSKEEKPLGTCGPLSLLRSKFQIEETFIVMNGDILSTIDFRKLYEFSRKSDTDLVVATKMLTTPFEFGNVIAEGDRIVDVEEKKGITTEIIAGIYAMKSTILDYIPDDTYFGMDDLIKGLLALGRPILRYPVHEYWLDIGRMDDYRKAQDAYATHFSEEPEAVSR